MLQRKFHVLVQKIELWYIGDISSVVNTCIILRNMMVANRIDSGEVESDAFYVYDITIKDVATTEEAERAHVNRRVAEMELHKHLYGMNNADLARQNRNDPEAAAILEFMRLQYIQRRWECLYDAQEHHRLRGAIIDHLN